MKLVCISMCLELYEMVWWLQLVKRKYHQQKILTSHIFMYRDPILWKQQLNVRRKLPHLVIAPCVFSISLNHNIFDLVPSIHD